MLSDNIRYGSVCSGVEAATVAWHPLGFSPVFFSEIEKFPNAVLDHHYPNVTNFGDMTAYKEWNANEYPIDLLVGGTPCQSFSVAGLRKGLDDPRGNLALTYLGIADKFKPSWVLWENVPGVLSSNGGRDFGSFLGALGEIGYGFAYRVLDAQYFGVAQRRRRVFVVGYLGDWRRAAAVLFERESLSGYPAPIRRTGKETSYASENCAATVGALCARTGISMSAQDAQQGHMVPISFGGQNSASQGNSVSDHVTPTLDKSKTPAVFFDAKVRRLTPRECERLQGFPDDYTLIPYRNRTSADGPRYKAIGNSMAVPVMRWIGFRIKEVHHVV